MNMVEKKKGKTIRKKERKARWMWLEQLFFQIDELKTRCEKLEVEITSLNETVKFLSDELQKIQEKAKVNG